MCGPGGEGVLASCAFVWREQPEALRIFERGFESVENALGEAFDHGGLKAFRAEDGCDARCPGGERTQDTCGGGTCGELLSDAFEEGVDGVAEGAGGDGAFGAFEVRECG